MKNTLVLVFVLLVGCGTSITKVVQTGPDSFMIAGEAGDFGGSNSADVVSVDLYKQASAYCSEQKKQLKVIKTGGRDGNFSRRASSRLDFTCVNKG